MKTITEKDLETLPRYDYDWEGCWPDENNDWEYVRWDSLIELLK